MFRRMAWSLAAVVLVSLGLVLPLCNWLFACGCSMAHGEALCNIHTRMVPHCPWCEHRASAFVPAYGSMFCGAAVGSYLAMRLLRPRIWVGMAGGLAGFACAAPVARWLMGWMFHYPQ
jgi:hypothetical protein